MPSPRSGDPEAEAEGPNPGTDPYLFVSVPTDTITMVSNPRRAPMRRMKLSKGQSRGRFARGTGTHRKNLAGNPMRGGIRL